MGDLGALAFIFSNKSLRAFLTPPLFIDHQHHGPGGGLRNIDSMVGAWCQAAGLPYFVHVPSLVQHIGETSTLWRSASATGQRRAADFVGQAFQPDVPSVAWPPNLPGKIRLAIAGVQPDGCSDAALFDGDYILDLVDRDATVCRWELQFDPHRRLYRRHAPRP